MRTLHFLFILCLLPASCFLLLPAPASAQITFQKTFGGTDGENIASAQQTSDGGYIVIGTTESFGAGGNDIYLIKTDTYGDTIWTKPMEEHLLMKAHL